MRISAGRVSAADAFLATLSEQQQQRVLFSFDDEEMLRSRIAKGETWRG